MTKKTAHSPARPTSPCELLAPAGSLEKLYTAIHYGADAVYLGGKDFSLRAHAANFSEPELREAIAFAHSHGVKVYSTVNIFAHNRDLAGLPDHLETLQAAGVDAIIVADPGVMRLARRTTPELPIHLSTQANVTNRESALFWQEQGVRRVNLARELTLAEIAEIKQATDLEVEVFVHGALCISYSGRCMLSLYMTGRNANQGDCAHPCRYSYTLQEEKRPGQFFPVTESARGTHIFNSRDLCLLDWLPQLLAAGVDSVKIEGRMKGVYYAGSTVRLYRAALDHIGENRREKESKTLPDEFQRELATIGTRGYTENFINGPPTAADILYEGARVRQEYAPAAVILAAGESPEVEVKNPINRGDTVEYMNRGLTSTPCKVIALRRIPDLAPLERANPGDRVLVTTSPPAHNWQAYGLLRKRILITDED